jgi:prevent-host-death family protein
VREAHVSKRPIVVTEGGRPKAVLMSLDVYEKGENERQILRLLAQGEQEIAADKGYDLADVLNEAIIRRRRKGSLSTRSKS